jgi:hypothetical protein
MAIATRSIITALAALGAMAPAAVCAQDAQKAYTLFMGANISVNLDKAVYPVRDVNGSSWVVDIDGQQKVVSASWGPINLKIVPSMKLTEASATIVGFKRVGAYTFANDPSVRMTRGLNEAANVNAGYQAAASQANAINPAVVTTGSASGTHPGGSDIMAQDTAGDASQSAAAGAAASVDMQAKQEAAGYDAMSVGFEISSPKPLEDPYVVTMTRFHPKGSEPGTVQSLVYAKALDAIGPNPTKVHFSEEGFPIDYEVIDFQIHLYNAGIEVATNVADKRTVMTPDQAFEYVKKSYIEAHKSDTMHAAPVMGELPADLGSHIAAGSYADTIYVKVSKDGLADEAFADITCSKRIDDPYLESVVRTIRFKPALADGKPVEGVASLNLSRMRI